MPAHAHEPTSTPTVFDPARLALLVFAQMLPATLVAPAIRPLFAALHGGREGPMHAFMALNMLGGLVAAPVLGRLADRLRRPRRLLFACAALDAVLLVALAAPLPTSLVLALRVLEGGAHIGAASLLMAEAASLARARGDGRAMGLAGAALMMAIALGSGLGGLLVGLDVRALFWAGSLVSAAVALAAVSSPALPSAVASPRAEGPTRLALLREHPLLLLPVSSAFVGRFSVGCLIVTVSLFCHRVHGLSDRAVGGMFTLLTLPFALAMYPAARLTDVISRAAVLASGAALYAALLLCLPFLPAPLLPPAMLVMGLASAMIFAPTLCYAATLGGPNRRAGSMALVNAGSCLGMLLGPMVAGIVTAAMKARGMQLAGYRAVFLVAGFSVLAWLAVAAPALWRQRRLELDPVSPPRRGPFAPASDRVRTS
jgi:MFS family permease